MVDLEFLDAGFADGQLTDGESSDGKRADGKGSEGEGSSAEGAYGCDAGSRGEGEVVVSRWRIVCPLLERMNLRYCRWHVLSLWPQRSSYTPSHL